MMRENLDCRGMVCPLPIIHTRLKLNALVKDDEMVILSDDPTYAEEFARFCQLADLELVFKIEHPDYQEYLVKVLR